MYRNTFKFLPNLWRVNGVTTTAPTPPVTTLLHVHPNRILDLTSRRDLYLKYKIKEVIYRLVKKDHPKHSTGPITAEYEGCDFILMFPNLNNEPLPVVGDAAGEVSPQQYYDWCVQQPGCKKIFMSQLQASMSVPAVVSKNIDLEVPGGEAAVTQTVTMPMPWMDIDVDTMDDFNCGQVVVVVPPVSTSTFYTVYDTEALQDKNPGMTTGHLKKFFSYSLEVDVVWAVKDKWLNPLVVADAIPDVKTTLKIEDPELDEFVHIHQQ